MRYRTDPKRGFCSCPSWIYQRKPASERTCKHLKRLVPDTGDWKRTDEVPSLMLCARNAERKAMPGWFCSEKLDGIRGRFIAKRGILVTRRGIVVRAPPRIVRVLEPLRYDVDGEFWSKTKSRQQILDAVLSGNRWTGIDFFAFDCVIHGRPRMRFTDRYRLLLRAASSSGLKLIPHVQKRTAEQIWALLNKVAKKGGEGLVMKDPDGIYAKGRSSAVRKLKVERAGRARVVSGGRTFSLFREVGTGKEFKMRNARGKTRKGQSVKFVYYGRTATGKPEFPKLGAV